MKIDFYILEDASKQQALLFACQLIEKKYLENESIYTHFATDKEANQFDQLLWTFREDSFVPHQLTNDNRDGICTIEIGDQQPNPHLNNVMINLSNQLPTCHPQFQHLIEIISADANAQQLARDRYRQYRELGYELNTQKIKVN